MVVGLIAILSSILVVAIGKMQTNAKRQQTTQILENCRAAWAEYDSVNRRHFDNFPMYAPGVVSNTDVTSERYGLDVVLTQSIFALMRAQPSIRASTDKFSTGKMTMPPSMANSTSPVPQAAPYSGNNYTLGVGAPGQSQSAFCSQIPDTNTNLGAVYLCIHIDTTQTPHYIGPPPDSGFWLAVGGIPMSGQVVVDTTTPVFLDGWGNPIICVIGGQLGSPVAVGQPGALVTAGQSTQITSPDKRLFWASAGPDGDFSKGDDNLYSFEK